MKNELNLTALKNILNSSKNPRGLLCKVVNHPNFKKALNAQSKKNNEVFFIEKELMRPFFSEVVNHPTLTKRTTTLVEEYEVAK